MPKLTTRLNEINSSPRIEEYERTEPAYCRTQWEDKYKNGVPENFKEIWFGRCKAGYYYGEKQFYLDKRLMSLAEDKPLYNFEHPVIFKKITKEEFEKLKQDKKFFKCR